MTETTKTITIWKSGFSVPDVVTGVYEQGRVCYRGEVVTLGPSQIELTIDRAGNSWLDLSEEQQQERWGEIRFRIGDRSDEVAFVGDDDSTVRFRRRENAVLAARKITDPDESKKAWAEINRLYGPGDSGQRTIAKY